MRYMQCVNVRDDLTRHRYTLRGLVSQKSKGFFSEFDVRGVQIGFSKVQGAFIKFPSIECVSISLKLGGLL